MAKCFDRISTDILLKCCDYAIVNESSVLFILPFITHNITPFLNTFSLLIRVDSGFFSFLFNSHLQFKL